MIRDLNRTDNGQIFRCSLCNKIHIEFKSINFNFDDKEYDFFRKYINDLDGEYIEFSNSHMNLRRKIVIPVGHRNMNFLLNNTELVELKKLLVNAKVGKQSIKLVNDFKYTFCNN